MGCSCLENDGTKGRLQPEVVLMPNGQAANDHEMFSKSFFYLDKSQTLTYADLDPVVLFAKGKNRRNELTD